MGARRVFFYVQHLLGIGHLARASRIASALAAGGYEVTVVTGGSPVPGFPGSDVKHVALPPVLAGDKGFTGLADGEGNPVSEDFKQKRRDLLIEAFLACNPDIVIFEAFPFGRRQMRFELMPLLEVIEKQDPRPLVAASLRDILQERTKPGRAEETLDVVRAHFDLVLVHGDPAFARLEETYPYSAEIKDKIVYTGLVAGNAPEPPAERFDVLVSAGGGAVGKELIGAALQAAGLLASDLKWCLITGPNLPQNDYDAFAAAAPANVHLFRFRKDFASLLSGTRLSVSQAGYNTVCDIFRAGCASLLIPFVAGGETEQSTRAARLEKLGLAGVLPEAEVTPERLARDIEAMLERPRPDIPPLDLDGATKTAEILDRHARA
ncbi:glycosyltransferase family protein [Ensifer adhaerens]|uniref:glycosyltransferase family protein n=1 Tax=Ensifer adhaerens TaxID=106592 RepID=UPI001177D519|nr:glycosyltransferase [Ensifer adhaerens]